MEEDNFEKLLNDILNKLKNDKDIYPEYKEYIEQLEKHIREKCIEIYTNKIVLIKEQIGINTYKAASDILLNQYTEKPMFPNMPFI